jgi:hypothetical protein
VRGSDGCTWQYSNPPPPLPTPPPSVCTQVHCTVTDVGTGACVNNPTGGHWRGGAQTLTLESLAPSYFTGAAVALRYTLDGTQPTPSSPSYTAPIPLTGGGVTVTAEAFVNGVGTGVVTVATYTPW